MTSTVTSLLWAGTAGIVLLTASACTSSSPGTARDAGDARDPDASTGAGGAGAEDGGTAEAGKGSVGGKGAGGSNGGASSGTGGKGSGGKGGSAGFPVGVGVTDPSVKTALPALPSFASITATSIDDNVDIRFFPIDGARDYRVYALPDDKDVSSDNDGHVTVKNAIYRCAGDRQTPKATMDAKPIDGNVATLVDNQDVRGFTRKLPDATLGYVYITPGDGRVPVYAMGDPNPSADNSCFSNRWGASRAKKYVFAQERTELLAKSWRDDGIVFYVPASASAKTRTVFTTLLTGGQERVYFIDGAEAQARGSKTDAFQVLTAAETGTAPLMRVFYSIYCGYSHDELVAGQEWFQRVRAQGDQTPVFDLHWAGIDKETTLVVEALDDGCPFPGILSTKSIPAYKNPDYGYENGAWLTLDQARAASPTGEVYVNGQHDPKSTPRPIARSFIKISPGPKPAMDWFMGFKTNDELGALKTVNCGEPSGNCFQEFRMNSDKIDGTFYYAEGTDRWAFSTMLGELWVTYEDWAADSNGKFRLTSPVKAQMNADSYLHTTMTVDSFTTGRRYPQILISDVATPIHAHMPEGNTLVIQTFQDWPNSYEVQACDHRYWDVNMQCPRFDTYHARDPKDPTKIAGLLPNVEVGEVTGEDMGTRYDVYASTKRVYLFLDGAPYSCTDIGAQPGVPSGAVSVTFGDVIYHSGVDKTFAFTAKYMQRVSRRHYDNLGFKSGEPAPDWDESRFPCSAQQF